VKLPGKAAAFQIDMQEFLFIGILGILRRCKAMQQFTVHHSNCTVLVLTLHHPPYCFLTMTSTFRLGFKEELSLDLTI
jgi:hypothetical protein